MANTLVSQGNQLATSGHFADALEKFQRAIEVDPYDPAPVYQGGMCLMELGAYGKARESFDDVERLASGWFRCRFDRWLAGELENGTVTQDEFRLVRVLDDGGLSLEEAKPIAHKAVERYPQFAPFYLFLGEIHFKQGHEDEAMACYRKGLELVTEPDLESRLLCAVAGALPVGSSERVEVVRRAVSLDGSVIAKAMAAFIPVK